MPGRRRSTASCAPWSALPRTCRLKAPNPCSSRGRLPHLPYADLSGHQARPRLARAIRDRIARMRPTTCTSPPKARSASWRGAPAFRSAWPSPPAITRAFREYLSARLPVPQSWSYRWMRSFHNAGSGTLVATPSLQAELSARGFDRLRLWSRGVDTAQFHPSHRQETGLPGPVMLSVGRVAVEKNLTAFLDLDVPGTKMVRWRRPRTPGTHGALPRRALSRRQDRRRTRAALRLGGRLRLPEPYRHVRQRHSRSTGKRGSRCRLSRHRARRHLCRRRGGALSNDLAEAVRAALAIPRQEARDKALDYSWAACAATFMTHVRAARLQAQATPATRRGTEAQLRVGGRCDRSDLASRIAAAPPAVDYRLRFTT